MWAKKSGVKYGGCRVGWTLGSQLTAEAALWVETPNPSTCCSLVGGEGKERRDVCGLHSRLSRLNKLLLCIPFSWHHYLLHQTSSDSPRHPHTWLRAELTAEILLPQLSCWSGLSTMPLSCNHSLDNPPPICPSFSLPHCLMPEEISNKK